VVEAVVEPVVEAVCEIVANLANYIEIESSIVADPVQSTSKTDSSGEGTHGTVPCRSSSWKHRSFRPNRSSSFASSSAPPRTAHARSDSEFIRVKTYPCRK
jgi:hypothetical protein